MRFTRLVAVLLGGLICLMVAACPRDSDTREPAQSAAAAAAFDPAKPIPAMHPWLSWADLRLGMSNFDLSQVYNAPEGYGNGFTRTQQYFGQAVNQYINFDEVEGEPVRKLICALYRDKLFRLVDRREGVSAEQAAAWLDECKAQFGDEPVETIGGAQWTWRDEAEDITVTFTQDNAGEQCMTAQLEITHMPTFVAWQAYNRDWGEKHAE
ncbi:hypothetical protein JW859_05535 [bacterium]|nr:hypothetical protein [bacterium]